jgi:S-formylglutathione hydrolase FrmB
MPVIAVIRLPFHAMKTSLIGLPFLWSLVVVCIGFAVFAWRARSGARRALAIVLASVFGLVTTAAWVNHHYGYLPDVGAILGQRAADQASTTQVATIAARAQQAAEIAQVTAPPTAKPVVPVLRHGLVERVRIPGTVSHFPARSAQVYLPPAWFDSPRPHLPVIELLHGTPGTPEDWTRAGRADMTADRWAAAHDGVAPIIVMPDPNGSFTADTECVNGSKGQAQTYLAIDVPNWVVANLGAASSRSSWVIAGSSEGGFCALDIALHHPDQYATFLDFSGLDRPTYPGGAQRLLGSAAAVQQHTAEWYVANRPSKLPLAGWFEVGAADSSNRRSAERVAAVASAHGIETHVVVVPHGAHSWRVWVRAFEDALPWAATRVGLSPTVSAGSPYAPTSTALAVATHTNRGARHRP